MRDNFCSPIALFWAKSLVCIISHLGKYFDICKEDLLSESAGRWVQELIRHCSRGKESVEAKNMYLRSPENQFSASHCQNSLCFWLSFLITYLFMGLKSEHCSGQCKCLCWQLDGIHGSSIWKRSGRHKLFPVKVGQKPKDLTHWQK